MEDLRHGAALLGAHEQAVGEAGLGVSLLAVRERKQVDRKEDVEELQRIARRLGETMVERSAPGASNLVEDAVEHPPPLLVLVEALIQKVAEKPSALRHAPPDGAAQARRRVGG